MKILSLVGDAVLDTVVLLKEVESPRKKRQGSLESAFRLHRQSHFLSASFLTAYVIHPPSVAAAMPTTPYGLCFFNCEPK